MQIKANHARRGVFYSRALENWNLVEIVLWNLQSMDVRVLYLGSSEHSDGHNYEIRPSVVGQSVISIIGISSIVSDIIRCMIWH